MKRKKFNKEPFKGIQLDMAPRDKKTVQQHEWRIKTANRTLRSWTCELCGCIKVQQLIMQGPTYYYEKDWDSSTTTQPQCTTSKTNEHETL